MRNGNDLCINLNDALAQLGLLITLLMLPLVILGKFV
jgi:hypothetical protein